MKKTTRKTSLYSRLRRLKIKELHRHPFAIPAGAFLLLFFICLGLFINFNGREEGANDAHVVIISSDGKRQTVPTRADNVGDFLKRINVNLNEGDVVEPTKDTEIVDDNFRVNVYRARPVTVLDGEHRTEAFSAGTTPRSVAEAAGVTIYPEDKLTSQPTTDFLREGTIGEQIVIKRATPMTLNLYGTSIAVRTHAKTVGDLLKEKQVKLAGGDSVTPVATTPVSEGLQVFVTRFGVQIVTQEEEIPMPSETVIDNSLTLGTTAVRQQGSPGKKIVTYEVKLENGKEIDRHEIQETISVEPVTQIIARGRAVDIPADKEAVMAAAGIAPGDYGFVSYIVSRESGWCPTKWQGEHYCPPYFEDIHSINSGFGYGLGQATPASKMAGFGADWQTSAVTQLRWASTYAKGRYGTWEAAYNYWYSHHNW